MKTDITTLPISDYRKLVNQAVIPTTDTFRINFKGYTVEDLECKYCLHYGGKSKGCRIVECCCEEEKQQAAITAANNLLEVSL